MVPCALTGVVLSVATDVACSAALSTPGLKRPVCGPFPWPGPPARGRWRNVLTGRPTRCNRAFQPGPGPQQPAGGTL